MAHNRDFLLDIVAEAFNPNNSNGVMSKLSTLECRLARIESDLLEQQQRHETRNMRNLTIVTLFATVITTLVQPVIGVVIARPGDASPAIKEKIHNK